MMPKVELSGVETVAYSPEFSWNYEVGSHLTLADRTLMLDGALRKISCLVIDRHDDADVRLHMRHPPLSRNVKLSLAANFYRTLYPPPNFSEVHNDRSHPSS